MMLVLFAELGLAGFHTWSSKLVNCDMLLQTEFDVGVALTRMNKGGKQAVTKAHVRSVEGFPGYDTERNGIVKSLMICCTHARDRTILIEAAGCHV